MFLANGFDLTRLTHVNIMICTTDQLVQPLNMFRQVGSPALKLTSHKYDFRQENMRDIRFTGSDCGF